LQLKKALLLAGLFLCLNLPNVTLAEIPKIKVPTFSGSKIQIIDVRKQSLTQITRTLSIVANYKDVNILYSKDLEKIINDVSQKVGIDKRLLKAVIYYESGGNIRAISKAGAIGLMQLMPSTAEALGVNPYDPYQNVYGGAKYLKYLLKRFNGNVIKTLMAYSAGPNREVFPETSRNYAYKVARKAGIR